MNPWTILGWIIVSIFVLFTVTYIVAVIVRLVHGSWPEPKPEVDKAEFHEYPHFPSLKPGACFSGMDGVWEMIDIESEYDVEKQVNRIRITAREVFEPVRIMRRTTLPTVGPSGGAGDSGAWA